MKTRFGIAIILMAIMGFALHSTGAAQDAQSAGGMSARPAATLYFFWGQGCPHCKKEIAFLRQLKREVPQLAIRSFETQNNKRHAQLYLLMTKAYGVKPLGVPATFLGDNVWIGFNPRIAEQIRAQLDACLADGCEDPIARLRAAKPSQHVVRNQETLSTLKPVCVNAFLHKDCPQCARVRPLLTAIEERRNVEVAIHDVDQPQTLDMFNRFRRRYGVRLSSFPTVFVGDRVLIGASAIEKNLDRQVRYCSEKGCACPTDDVEALAPYPPKPKDITLGNGETVDIPFVGEVDAGAISLPLFTVIIGGLDGFNPCAFFVLFVLLGMLIHARSRARMLLVGGTFVFFSGAIYFLFMSAWLNLFLLIGTIRYVTIVAAVVALIIGVLNVKDYFLFKRGASLTIPERAKPKLFDRMRKLMRADSLISLLIGTVVLAIVANTYELLCTAGFPMVFTRVITLHDLSAVGRYLYLLLYNAVYVVPLLTIVIIFVITLGGRKLTEREGRMLKLLSGLMMLALGAVLLIRPELLNNAIVAVALLAFAVVVTAIIILVSKGFRRADR